MKTLRFLIVGDVHWRSTNPKSRLDNYHEAIRAKILECWEIGREKQVDAILQTGDLLHSPFITYSTLGELMRLIGQAPAPFFAVAGNHDLFEKNPGSLYRTPLGLLYHVGLVNDIAKERQQIGDVILSGRHNFSRIDQDPMDYALSFFRDEEAVHIHQTHGSIVKAAFPGPHTLVTDLQDIPVDVRPDIIVNGHIHDGMPVYDGFGNVRQRGVIVRSDHSAGPIIINPGALCRYKADVDEFNRTIQVAVLEIKKSMGEFIYKVDMIPLKSAKPASEVLSREHLEAETEQRDMRESFFNLLRQEREEEFLEVTDMIAQIAHKERIDAAVRERALKYIAAAGEEDARALA